MSVAQFRDNDASYTTWLAANVQGYVLNIRRSLNPSDARIHSHHSVRNLPVLGDYALPRKLTAGHAAYAAPHSRHTGIREAHIRTISANPALGAILRP
jgi:hypothetical protein